MSGIAFPVRLAWCPARLRLSLFVPWLLLAPSLLFLVLFTYWPVVQVAWRSLVVQRFGTTPAYGLGNYTRLLADTGFGQAALNTVLYALGTVVPSLLLALGFALVLRDGTRVVAVLRTLLVLPMLVPLVAAAALFTFILLPGAGLLDHYLAWLGIGATNWLGDPSLALGSVVAITVWKNTGYYMLFFLAGLAAVPEDLVDAARLEGANAWQRFRHVVLPLLGPTLGFVAVIALLNVLTQVDHVITMTRGGPSGTTSMLLYYIYEQAHQNGDLGLTSAATVASVAALLCLALLSLRTLERGIHYES